MESTQALLPPISHTGVEPAAVVLGWWAGTLRPWDESSGRSVAWDIFRSLDELLPGPSNMNSRSQWYQRGFARDDGAATVYYDGIGDARGSIMLSLRQSWFERLPDHPVPAIAGLLTGWHVSRVDLAADVSAPDRHPPSALFAALPAARSRSRLANRVLTVDGAGGEKLTIGSRSSDRYVRIYVKDERVRHEIELKHAIAGGVWAELVAGRSLLETWREQYGRVVQWH